MGLNRYEVIGNVGKDPEIIKTAGGKTIAKFSVATNEYAGKDGHGKAKYETEWHSVKVFGQSAEYTEKQIKAGDVVFVSGRHKTETYDKKDGTGKGYSIFCQVGLNGRVERVSRKEGTSNGNGNGNGNSSGAAEKSPEVEDEIPF